MWLCLQPYIQDSIAGEYKNLILELKLHRNYGGDLLNGYIRAVRLKYWEALFQKREFVHGLTSNLQERLHSRVSELGDFEFSEYNIITLRFELSKETVSGIEETILNLFDKFSERHSWINESSKNIHYYRGWKTNKAWKINKKVIIPYYGACRQIRCS